MSREAYILIAILAAALVAQAVLIAILFWKVKHMATPNLTALQSAANQLATVTSGLPAAISSVQAAFASAAADDQALPAITQQLTAGVADIQSAIAALNALAPAS